MTTEQLFANQQETLPIPEAPTPKRIAEHIAQCHIIERLGIEKPKYVDIWTHGEGQILAS